MAKKQLSKEYIGSYISMKSLHLLSMTVCKNNIIINVNVHVIVI